MSEEDKGKAFQFYNQLTMSRQYSEEEVLEQLCRKFGREGMLYVTRLRLQLSPNSLRSRRMNAVMTSA